MNGPQFVHLRVHSEYSISDSIVRIDALIERASADRQPAIAITDLANLFGWIKFYKAARAAGIKPILGVDAWITNETERDRPHRMLLLARNQTGYLTLCNLLSRAWLENEYRGRGELRAEWFDETGPDGGRAGDGLIALSGAHQGEIGQALLSGSTAQAMPAALRWAQRVTRGVYRPLQRTGQPESVAHTLAAARLAAQLQLPLVATQPVQYLEPSDYRAHEVRVCIAEGEILANPRRTQRFDKVQHFRSQGEMAELFAYLPSALANSVEIARRCNLSMTLGKARLPQFPVPDGVTLDDYMRDLALEGLRRRLDIAEAAEPQEGELAARWQSYRARLVYECDTIVAMG
ncbi:MAG: PHP domain-containing protein, partial [Betaproteobacteria bacterium]